MRLWRFGKIYKMDIALFFTIIRLILLILLAIIVFAIFIKKTYFVKIIILYFKFFILEIPNFIQIFSLLTFFSIFLQNIQWRLNLIWATSSLLGFYLIEKSYEFLKDQVTDIHSEVNRHNLKDKDVLIFWTILAVITIIGFALLSGYLSEIIKPVIRNM